MGESPQSYCGPGWRMQLINNIRVIGFRSIFDEVIKDCGEHFVFVGKNSCGKSNALRALNVFFNGETSPGVSLDFDRDVYYRPLRKQKKLIRVEVAFRLPQRFRFRKGLGHLAKLGNAFTVRKTWTLDQQRRVEEASTILVNGSEIADGAVHAREFLALIRFRYIPNRTVPAELLRGESQVIAAAIFKKMRESTKADDLLREMTASAGKLLSATSDALKASGAPLDNPNVLTSGTLGEMLRMSGFQAVGLNGASVRDEDWGSGHQAFFLMNLLREIDTDYSRQFGWRQACIWAVEEPESGLHHDLQTQIAGQFLGWASDKNRRLQIFTTTHSPVIAMAADSGCLVELNNVTSKFMTVPVPKLVHLAEDRGVTTYLHPALSYPFNTVVVVEGYCDEIVMNHVAKVFGYNNLRFVTLPTIDGNEANGIDAIQAYLRRYSKLIAKRALSSPLMALADWDVSNDQLKAMRSAYGVNGDKYVLRFEIAQANPMLDESFRGIERYYPTSVIDAAYGSGDMVVGFPVDKSTRSVAPTELGRAKRKMATRVCELDDPAQLGYLANMLKRVVAASTSFADGQMKLAV